MTGTGDSLGSGADQFGGARGHLGGGAHSARQSVHRGASRAGVGGQVGHIRSADRTGRVYLEGRNTAWNLGLFVGFVGFVEVILFWKPFFPGWPLVGLPICLGCVFGGAALFNRLGRILRRLAAKVTGRTAQHEAARPGAAWALGAMCGFACWMVVGSATAPVIIPAFGDRHLSPAVFVAVFFGSVLTFVFGGGALVNLCVWPIKQIIAKASSRQVVPRAQLEALGEQEGLGGLRATYEYDPKPIMTVNMVVIGIVGLGFLAALITPFFTDPPPPKIRGLMIFLGILIALLIVQGVLRVVVALHQAGLRRVSLYAYDNGLIYREYGRCHVIPWRDMREVRYEGPDDRYVITRDDGARLTLHRSMGRNPALRKLIDSQMINP